jgi:hypothetical protein
VVWVVRTEYEWSGQGCGLLVFAGRWPDRRLSHAKGATVMESAVTGINGVAIALCVKLGFTSIGSDGCSLPTSRWPEAFIGESK